MAAFYFCKSQYMCFFTGDSTPLTLDNFFKDCIDDDLKNNEKKVYTLCWTPYSNDIKEKSIKDDLLFFYDKTAFSDQCYFLNIKKFNFKKILQNYTSNMFPHLDAFESRFYSYMQNNNLTRLVYKKGLYIHKNY
jgi:hypothetical protein